MEAVKLQPNGRHVVSTGHNFSMPLAYGGWFEVLSEDGKAIEPVSTVAKLATLWPPECVVREPLRAIVCSGTKHDNPDQLGTTRLDQVRTVTVGEWLALRDVVEATVESTSHVEEMTSGPDNELARTKQYLRCVDAVGDSVFLAMNQVLTFDTVLFSESCCNTTRQLTTRRGSCLGSSMIGAALSLLVNSLIAMHGKITQFQAQILLVRAVMWCVS